MAKARRKKLHTALLVAALLTAGLLGTVDATQQVESQQIMNGHSTYVDASTSFNSCFAGVAGLVLQRVTWFNGQTLFTRADSGGDKWVLVDEHLNDDDGDKYPGEDEDDNGWNESTGFRVGIDPSEKTLYRTNQTYKFDDENNRDKEWIVREYFMLRDKREMENDVNDVEDVDEDDYVVTKEKWYVFAVKVTNNAIQDGTLHQDYNFAMVIDTCRFKYGMTGEAEHEDGKNGTTGMPAGQHDSANADNENHTHDEFAVDIWIGDKPSTIAGDNAQVPDDRGNESTKKDAEDGKP